MRATVDLIKLLTITEEWPASRERGAATRRKVAVVAVVENPLAGRFEEDLVDLSELGERLAVLLADKLSALVDLDVAVAMGRGAIVGQDGEMEHAAALIGPRFQSAAKRALFDTRGGGPSVRTLSNPGGNLEIVFHAREGLEGDLPADLVMPMQVRTPGHPAPSQAVVALAVAMEE